MKRKPEKKNRQPWILPCYCTQTVYSTIIAYNIEYIKEKTLSQCIWFAMQSKQQFSNIIGSSDRSVIENEKKNWINNRKKKIVIFNRENRIRLWPTTASFVDGAHFPVFSARHRWQNNSGVFRIDKLLVKWKQIDRDADKLIIFPLIHRLLNDRLNISTITYQLCIKGCGVSYYSPSINEPTSYGIWTRHW